MTFRSLNLGGIIRIIAPGWSTLKIVLNLISKASYILRIAKQTSAATSASVVSSLSLVINSRKERKTNFVRIIALICNYVLVFAIRSIKFFNICSIESPWFRNTVLTIDGFSALQTRLQKEI